MVTAMGVSVGLTVGRDQRRRARSRRRSAGPATCSPWTRSARGRSPSPTPAPTRSARCASTARRDGDEYVLNGSKTFITNGPYADTIVFICKLDEGNPPAERKVLQFVLDRGMPGLEQSKPLRKMGLHSSPTGDAVPRRRAGRPRPPARRDRGRSRPAVARARKATFVHGALRCRGDGARHHRARASSCCVDVRQGPRAVRPADRRVPAHPAQARQDGGRAAQRREPRVPACSRSSRPASR